jgi:hypothetical protein
MPSLEERIDSGGYLTAVRDQNGLRIVGLLGTNDGTVLALVHPTAEKAENPPAWTTGVRRPSYQSAQLVDAYDVFMAAAGLNADRGRPVGMLWPDGAMVPQEILSRYEAILVDSHAALPVEALQQLRVSAWSEGFDSPVDGDLGPAILRHGGYELQMLVKVAPGEALEYLIARYRGSPRQLTPSEVELIMAAAYDGDGISRDQVSCPHEGRTGLLSVFLRRVQLGPRRV